MSNKKISAFVSIRLKGFAKIKTNCTFTISYQTFAVAVHSTILDVCNVTSVAFFRVCVLFLFGIFVYDKVYLSTAVQWIYDWHFV